MEVSVRSYELFCRVTVADTGPGIPESEHPKIFRRFYRAPAAEKVPGSGLGLYLAREIAAGEGGGTSRSRAGWGKGAGFRSTSRGKSGESLHKLKDSGKAPRKNRVVS